MKSQEKTIIALRALAAAFDKELPELTLEAYLDGLSDLSGEAAVGACRQLMRTARFFPRIAEIRELVESRCSTGASAAEQWAIAFCGAPGEVNATAERVIQQMGGKHYLTRQITESELHTWKSKDFHTLYADARRREGARKGDVDPAVLGRASRACPKPRPSLSSQNESPHVPDAEALQSVRSILESLESGNGSSESTVDRRTNAP